MLIGDSNIFAIESSITHAYNRLSLKALGFFLIHIQSFEYGVRSSNATMLANSYESVKERLMNRGCHEIFFSKNADAAKIADNVIKSLYAENQEHKCFFNVLCCQFREFIYENKIIWAPDGDEAFDDGSMVLQFDVENKVRLIGFKKIENYQFEPNSLRDLWIESNVYYGILEEWLNTFEAEWCSMEKSDVI